jgi:hypothetical protein
MVGQRLLHRMLPLCPQQDRINYYYYPLYSTTPTLVTCRHLEATYAGPDQTTRGRHGPFRREDWHRPTGSKLRDFGTRSGSRDHTYRHTGRPWGLEGPKIVAFLARGRLALPVSSQKQATRDGIRRGRPFAAGEMSPMGMWIWKMIYPICHQPSLVQIKVASILLLYIGESSPLLEHSRRRFGLR